MAIWAIPKWTDINFRWGFPKSIIKFSFQSSHKLLINLDSRSWVAASEMWRAGIKIQDAKKGRDCQNGRRWWQGGQGESDGWFFGRVCECEIISQACWFFFLQEHSSFGEHRLCRNGGACAWPAPCGQCWYDDDWNFLSELLLAHINLSGLPRNLWKVPQTFGRAGRDKKLQAVGVQMYWPGQKGLLIFIFISTAMHMHCLIYLIWFDATPVTILTPECTTRRQVSLLEIKLRFLQARPLQQAKWGKFSLEKVAAELPSMLHSFLAMSTVMTLF